MYYDYCINSLIVSGPVKNLHGLSLNFSECASGLLQSEPHFKYVSAEVCFEHGSFMFKAADNSLQLHISFVTHLCPPISFMGELSAKFPDLAMEHNFSSSVCVYKGQDIYRSGVRTFCNFHSEYAGREFCSSQEAIYSVIHSEAVDEIPFGNTSAARVSQ
jgi:hypothetical protein